MTPELVPYLTHDGAGFYATGLVDVDPPTRDMIVLAATSGLTLWFTAGPGAPETVDLGSYEDLVPLIQGLGVGKGVRLDSPEILEDAVELRELSVAGRVNGLAELAELPRLTNATVSARLKSAAANPNLRFLDYRDPKGLPPLVTAPLQSLSLRAREIPDLSSIQQPESLTRVDLDTTGALNLGGLTRASRLRELAVTNASMVTGGAELTQLPLIHELWLDRVHAVDSIAWLSDLSSAVVHVWGNHIVDADLRMNLLLAHPDWDIEPLARGSRAVSGPFTISAIDHAYQLSTSSWGWFDERLLAAGIAAQVDGYVIEAMAQAAVPGGVDFAFDAESSRFSATAPTLADAESLRDHLQGWWNDELRLARHFAG